MLATKVAIWASCAWVAVPPAAVTSATSVVNSAVSAATAVVNPETAVVRLASSFENVSDMAVILPWSLMIWAVTAANPAATCDQVAKIGTSQV